MSLSKWFRTREEEAAKILKNYLSDIKTELNEDLMLKIEEEIIKGNTISAIKLVRNQGISLRDSKSLVELMSIDIVTSRKHMN